MTNCKFNPLSNLSIAFEAMMKPDTVLTTFKKSSRMCNVMITKRFFQKETSNSNCYLVTIPHFLKWYFSGNKAC